MDNTKPLEDRIEDARAMGAKAGKAGAMNVNAFLPDMPEYAAWQEGYDAHKPAPESAEEIAEAAAQGAYYATRGAGFTNPYQLGTAKRRAWQKAYDETPKGVPKMSGPQGRSEAEQVGAFVMPNRPADVPVPRVEIREGPTLVANMNDPYMKLLEMAKVQGRTAREEEQPIGANPYNDPASWLEGPAEWWAIGWRQAEWWAIGWRQADREIRERQAERQQPAEVAMPSGAEEAFDIGRMAATVFGSVLAYHREIAHPGADLRIALEAAARDAAFVVRLMVTDLSKQ